MSFASEKIRSLIVFNGRMISPTSHNNVFICIPILLHHIGQTGVKILLTECSQSTDELRTRKLHFKVTEPSLLTFNYPRNAACKTTKMEGPSETALTQAASARPSEHATDQRTPITSGFTVLVFY